MAKLWASKQGFGVYALTLATAPIKLIRHRVEYTTRCPLDRPDDDPVPNKTEDGLRLNLLEAGEDVN